jgi:hypothetical protein
MTTQNPSVPLLASRWFYPVTAVLLAAIVFAGFAGTFYLRRAALPPLGRLLLVHGLVFTTWIVLFAVQSLLIVTQRRQLHMRLGWFRAALAVLVVVLGTLAAVAALRLGRAPIPGLDPRSFFVIPMGDMAVFGLFAGLGIWFRRSGQAHRRLMLLATLSIVGAAIARLPLAFIAGGGPVAFFGLTDLFVLAACGYDFVKSRRLHPALLWGGLVLILSQPLRLLLGGTQLWLGFATLFQ